MPTASDELRGLMNEMFGDPVSDAGPIQYLEERGYRLLDSWSWRKPTLTHKVTEEEGLCIAFLQDEWDFGGIHEPRKDR